MNDDMKMILNIIMGTLSLFMFVISVSLLIIILAITYLPHLIYKLCSWILADWANELTNVAKDVEMRNDNR